MSIVSANLQPENENFKSVLVLGKPVYAIRPFQTSFYLPIWSNAYVWTGLYCLCALIRFIQPALMSVLRFIYLETRSRCLKQISE